MTCQQCGGPHGRYRPRWEAWLCGGCAWRRAAALATERFVAGIGRVQVLPPLDWPEWTGM